ncbi:MAG: hypothetical protein WBM50_07230 [Acidimicrobiales bacterium]
MKINKFTAKIGLPFGLGEIGGEWEPGDAERKAAWEMYVELITRVTVVQLGREEGLLREALASYYSLFETTRRILKDGGPDLVRPSNGGVVSFGHLAVAILNNALRPLLAIWHPLLEDHEEARPAGVSRLEWERSWDREGELRAAIAEVRQTLLAYAGLLGDVCDARSLLSLTVRPDVEVED